MLKIKAGRLLSLSLAALLFSQSVVFASETQGDAESTPQDIIDVELFAQEAISYETYEVTRGSYADETSVNAIQYHAYTYNLQFEHNDAKFLEYTVSKDDEVKKGDVLARFTIDKSESELTRLRLSLQRAKEQMNEGIRTREQAMEATRAELAAVTDAYEKTILELTLQKQEVELAQYKYRQQYSINQAQADYEEEYEQRTTDVLVSPVDGTVQELALKHVDDPVSPSEVLVTVIAGASEMYLVENVSGQLRYNMPVEVNIYGGHNATRVSGRVVAADDAIPQTQRTGYALVQLDPHDYEVDKISRSTLVHAVWRQLDNVLTVPNKAVDMTANINLSTIGDDEIPYVKKLVDGAEKQRNITTGPSNMQSTLVIDGLEEGETVILGTKKGG